MDVPETKSKVRPKKKFARGGAAEADVIVEQQLRRTRSGELALVHTHQTANVGERRGSERSYFLLIYVTVSCRTRRLFRIGQK